VDSAGVKAAALAVQVVHHACSQVRYMGNVLPEHGQIGAALT
jgi:hypothetical protein